MKIAVCGRSYSGKTTVATALRLRKSRRCLSEPLYWLVVPGNPGGESKYGK